MSKLRLGTRGSLLAMAQANSLKGRLAELHPDLEVEIVTIKTSGDRGQREQIGAFVHEIQLAELDDRVDVGLHCLKDIPTEPVQGLTFAAYLAREDPRDTIITRGPIWTDLPPGSVIGTGSVRRTSQLASMASRPAQLLGGRLLPKPSLPENLSLDRFMTVVATNSTRWVGNPPAFEFKPLLGNVDTRLRKLIEGEYDAIVLAIAGLKRLGVLDRWAETDYRDLRVEPLGADVMLPAPGQAVLVLEAREDAAETRELLKPLHDDATERASTAERAFLKAFGGGCSVPVAAWAEVNGADIDLQGLVAAPDGSHVLRGQTIGSSTDIGERLAQELIAQGAMDLFASGVSR